jgi:acetyl esterase/lipase
MKILFTITILILIIWLLRASQMPLQAIDELLPYDKGSARTATDVAYSTDPRHRLDVYAPTSAGPFPVIVFVHGGSWSSGDKKDYGFLGRALASQGYIVFVPNYRLVPGHRYPAFVEDTAAAIAFAQKSASVYGGDNAAIYLMGHSAGAYNLAQAMLNPEFFVASGVDRTTIRAAALLAGPYDFAPLDVPSTVDAFGQWPDLSSTQPINYAAENAPPTLLLHGAKDTTVYPRNSRALAKLLGAKATLKEYQNLGHVGILLSNAKPLRWRAPVLNDVIAFFRAHPK